VKKYWKLMVLLIVSALIIPACSNKADNTSNGRKVKLIKNEDQVYVGFLIDTLKDARWYRDKKLFEKQVKDLGGEVKTLAANGLDDVQIDQAKLLIEEGVDILVVVPHNAEIAAKIVTMAHKSGVKVISYDRLITNANVDYYISFDNEKVGELQAKEILKHQPEGNFAYVGGAESDHNAILFRQGAMNVLKPLIDKGKVKLVYDQYTNEWDPETAKKNMQSLLKKRGNKIDAVIAANDGTAGGVIEALDTAGLARKVPVSGQDAELPAIHRILKGTQTMTVYKPISKIATEAAKLAVHVAEGKKVTTDTTINNGKINVPTILLEPIAVTKRNIKDTVIQDKFYTKQEVYQ